MLSRNPRPRGTTWVSGRGLFQRVCLVEGAEQLYGRYAAPRLGDRRLPYAVETAVSGRDRAIVVTSSQFGIEFQAAANEYRILRA
jgi:hypothetical protein